jgi:bifunctional non-homologous end joining protein LigD
LASSIERVPDGERWLHEVKFDGYRVQLHVVNEDVKVFTRRGNDWTKRFRKIANDAFLINAGSAIIDGEVVVPATDGTTDFSVLQNELKGKSSKIVMVAFDLLISMVAICGSCR